MSELWYSRPVFFVADVERADRFYTEKLGFEERWRHVDGGTALAAEVAREDCTLIFDCQQPDRTGRGRMFISLDPEPLRRLGAELEGRGAPLRDGWWGYDTMIVEDPDGNEPITPGPTSLGTATSPSRSRSRERLERLRRQARENAMLKDHDSSAILAVSDLGRARDFYEGVLGLELADEGAEEGVLVYKTGATRLFVYRSEFAGTNRGNAVVWDVPGQAGDERDEFAEVVAALEAKGAAFEHYPDIGRLEGNVHVAGRARLVWLKDPDGNILHINSM